METKYAVPEELKKRLDGRPVEAFASLDLKPDGSYGRSWLVMTGDKLLFLEGDQTGRAPSGSWALDGMKTIRIRNLTGNSFVLVGGDEGDREIGRFTQAASESVEYLVHKVHSRIAKDGEDRPEPTPKRPCPRCGLPIPQDHQACPVCFEKKRTFFLMLGLLKPFQSVAIFSVILSAILATMDLSQPFFTGYLIDKILIPAATARPGPEIYTQFYYIVAALLTIHFAHAGIGGWRGFLMGRVGERIVLDLRNRLYRHLQALSLSYFHRKQTGWIISRVANDTDRIQGFLQDGLPELLIDCLLVVGILTAMFLKNWQLALGVLIPVPVAFWGIKKFGRRMERIYHRAWRRFSLINALLGDVIPGVKVIKVFAQEKKERDKFDHRATDAYEHNMVAIRTSNIYYPAIWSIFGFGFISVWGWGGYLILEGGQRVTVGMLVTFIGLMWRFYEPINRLSRITNSFQRATTSAERVFEMLEERPEVAEPKNPKHLPGLKGRVTFEDVHFRYKEGEEVLKGISLDVAAGEMLGIVGTSGAGKTTLVGLVPRFYDAVRGRVLIDGVDVKELGLENLRGRMGMVLQDPFLFHGSIRDNIAYAEPGATESDVIEASEAANAHPFIRRFPEAYDSQVGERGVLLSGGEKQRISIARAILHDPKILILDEATSSVDTETEHQIQEAIFRLVANRTTFVIAHRLSTLRRCDRIIVVDKGLISEIGSHDELIAKGGQYFKLCNMQAEMSRVKAV